MTNDTHSSRWSRIRCRSYGADRNFQGGNYKDLAPTEHRLSQPWFNLARTETKNRGSPGKLLGLGNVQTSGGEHQERRVANRSFNTKMNKDYLRTRSPSPKISCKTIQTTLEENQIGSVATQVLQNCLNPPLFRWFGYAVDIAPFFSK
jgi:hypothetical protein